MRPRRRRQSGYALLFVFLMSAAVAVMLYKQLPRVAFESVRAREETLIERGEQYQRAIQLYVAALKKYPQNLDDLDKTNGRRFLRKRYKDPMTGKDEWRLLHVDAAGVVTDSKIQKKEEKKPSQNTFVSEFAGIGQTQSTGTTGVNIALRRRPSDGAPEGGPFGPGALPLPSSQEPLSQADAFAQFQKQQEALQKQQQAQQQGQQQGQQQLQQLQQQLQQHLQQQQQGQPGQPLPGATPNPVVPGGQPQIGPDGRPILPGVPMPAGQQQYPAPAGQAPGQYPGQMTVPQAYPNGVPQFPGAVGAGQQQTYPTGAAVQPGRPGAVGIPGTGMPGTGMPGAGMPGTGMPGTGTPGSPGTPPPGTPPNAALDMIRAALTSPSPNMPMNMAPGMALGPGIVGVASKYEAPAIKIYNEQQEYDKWEFVYDPRKDKRVQQQLAAAGVPQNGQQPGTPMGTPMGGPMGSPMGSPVGGPMGTPVGGPMGQPGLGAQPGFGAQPGVQPGMNPGMGFPNQLPGTGSPPPARPGSTFPVPPVGAPTTTPGGYPQQPGYPQPRR